MNLRTGMASGLLDTNVVLPPGTGSSVMLRLFPFVEARPNPRWIALLAAPPFSAEVRSPCERASKF